MGVTEEPKAKSQWLSANCHLPFARPSDTLLPHSLPEIFRRGSPWLFNRGQRVQAFERSQNKAKINRYKLVLEIPINQGMPAPLPAPNL
jgi:hypothetical protein